MSQTFLQPGLIAFGLGAACGGYGAPQNGVSEEASYIVKDFESLLKHQEASESLFGKKARLISELHEVAAECSEDNWDGYGATAVSEAVFLRAEALIRALPTEEDFPVPEFAAEPDGAISFDWLPARTKTFTLSVNSTDRLAYAWIDGIDRGHAAEQFTDGNFPKRALEELKRIHA